MSRITHGHPRACSACYLYALMVRELLGGAKPRSAYARPCSLSEVVLATGIGPEERMPLARILGGRLGEVPEEKIASSGYVIDTLEAALWCLLRYNDSSPPY